MARGFRRLRVFLVADQLAIDVYRATSSFPASERFVLQAQVRRSALSVPSNIVEGSARRTTREYVNFLNVANGSAAETLYLLSVARRLGWLEPTEFKRLEEQYSGLARGLQAMMRTLEIRA